MPARYKFLPEYGCLYLRFEASFLFGHADDFVKTFSSDPEFTRSNALIFDLSRLTNIRMDVGRSSETAGKVGKIFPAEGGQIAVLAPCEPGRSMADLLRELWAPFPNVPYHVFTSDEELQDHFGMSQEYWDRMTVDFQGATA